MHAVLPVFGVAGRAFPGRSPRGFPSSWSDSEPPAKSAFPAAVPRALSASDAAAASSPAVQRGELLRSGSSSATCGDLNAEFLQQHDWMQRAAWMRLATAGDAGNGADDAAAADAAERDYSGRRDDEIGDGEKCAATADDDSALDASNRTVEVDRTEQSKTVDRRNDVRVASSATRFLPKPPTASGTNPESVSNGDEDPAYWVDSTQTYHSVGWIGSNEHRHHETRHRDERFATARAPDDTYLRASHTRRSYLPHDETNAAGWLDDRDRTAVESWVNDSRRSLDEMWMDSARSRIRDAALQLVEAQQAALEHSRVASAMEAAMLERQKSLGRSPGGNGIGGKVRKSMLSWSPPANDLGLSRSSRSSPMRRLGGGGWGGGATGDNVGVARSGDGHDIELVPGRVRKLFQSETDSGLVPDAVGGFGRKRVAELATLTSFRRSTVLLCSVRSTSTVRFDASRALSSSAVAAHFSPSPISSITLPMAQAVSLASGLSLVSAPRASLQSSVALRSACSVRVPSVTATRLHSDAQRRAVTCQAVVVAAADGAPAPPAFGKGNIVRVDKEKYLNSVEFKAVDHPPFFTGLDYIYQARGEILDLKEFGGNQYALLSWAGVPTPPAWLPTSMLIKAPKLEYVRT
ncbi:unnamed protein product [Closterium sp. Yama58-4]|nr:unnamed protein product [Closterium sp. Yama58-4]